MSLVRGIRAPTNGPFCLGSSTSYTNVPRGALTVNFALYREQIGEAPLPAVRPPAPAPADTTTTGFLAQRPYATTWAIVRLSTPIPTTRSLAATVADSSFLATVAASHRRPPSVPVDGAGATEDQTGTEAHTPDPPRGLVLSARSGVLLLIVALSVLP
jgi:hypothetical protein